MSTRYRISTPVADFTGVVANCAFGQGKYEGEVEPGPLHYFQGAGYTVEVLDETPVETAAEDTADPLPGKAASKGDWVTAAVARGMSTEDAEKLTRDQLVEHLTKEGDAQ